MKEIHEQITIDVVTKWKFSYLDSKGYEYYIIVRTDGEAISVGEANNTIDKKNVDEKIFENTLKNVIKIILVKNKPEFIMMRERLNSYYKAIVEEVRKAEMNYYNF